MARKEQQLTISGVVKYVTVPDTTTYETRHQPTESELATLKDTLPAGFVWSVVPPSNSGATQVYVANPDVWGVAVQWQNGRARLAFTRRPEIPTGYQLYVWTSGQAANANFDPTYGYYPGDTERFYVAIAAGNQVYFAPFNIKTAINIYFGNPS